MSRGGSFCKFTVGRAGNSSRHLRYISRRDAVLDAERGVFLKDLPVIISQQPDYPALVQTLCRYARMAEETELLQHKARGRARTHYRATLSFERDLKSEDAGALVASWLKMAFPLARTATFLHRDTNHLHAHVWISARQTDGRKVNLNARDYRQLDEMWNALYAPALGRDMREHLLKKWETEGYKRLWREGKEIPQRFIQRGRGAKQFTERERKRLGADYERDKEGAGRDKPEVAGEYSGVGEREPIPDDAVGAVQGAVADTERAVSQARELCEEVARLVDRSLERDRER